MSFFYLLCFFGSYTLVLLTQAYKFIFSWETNDHYRDYNIAETIETKCHFRYSSFATLCSDSNDEQNPPTVFFLFQNVFANMKHHLDTEYSLFQQIQFVTSAI